MTINSGNLPPAGWYPDPANSAGYRWWNGTAWTDQTTGGAAATPQPQQPQQGAYVQQAYGSQQAAPATAPATAPAEPVASPTSSVSQSVSHNAYVGAPILLVTTAEVPGRTISDVTGVVVGTASTAEGALDQLRRAANKAGSSTVVGVSLSVAVAATTAIGTAVTLADADVVADSGVIESAQAATPVASSTGDETVVLGSATPDITLD